MNIQNIEKKEKNMATFEVKVPADVFDNAVNEAYKKNKNHLDVAGFRKGKAPRAVIEGMYGKEVFYPDAIEALAEDAFEAGRADCGFECVGAPSLIDQKVTEDKELIYTFEVGMYPEVQLGQYKGLEVPQNHEAFDESKVDEEMHNVQKRNARLLDVEREAKMGDHVTIDFAGFIDGEQFDGGTAEDYDLELGSNTFVPGFEEQIVGLKAGDEKELNITFPEDYVPDLAGKAVIFKVKVKEVKEHQAPVVDDEFAKDVSEFETLEEFKKSLGDKLLDSKTKSAQQEYENAVIEQLVGNMEADIPDAMVEVQLDKLMEDFSMRLSNQGMKMEDYLAMMGATPESMRASARPTAQRQVEVDLALTAVADAESITISDEELEEELKKIAGEYKLELDEVKRAIPVEDMKRDLRLRKASELVMAEAKVGEAPKKEEAEEKPKKTTRKKKAESAEGEEAAAEEKPKKTTRKKKAEEAEEPKAE